MKKIIILSFLCIITILILLLVGEGNIFMDPDLKYSQEYIIGESNIKGEVSITDLTSRSEDFDIGANKYGYAVFKNPSRAFKTLKKDYKEGIRLIQREYNLLPLSIFNYREYKVYGWQVTIGSIEGREQARFVSSFMDIYENSYR